MSNYCATIRTNYFSVTDEDEFRRIVDFCIAETKSSKRCWA